MQQVETFLGAKIEDYLSFVGNVGIGASYDGTKLQLGLAATVTDEATAQTRVTGLVSALRLGAMAAGLPIKVTDTTVNGTTVSTIDFGSYPGLPANLPIDTKVTIAVGGGHLYLGLGNFAVAALARTSADSLAGNARYSSAISAAGARGHHRLCRHRRAAHGRREAHAVESGLHDEHPAVSRTLRQARPDVLGRQQHPDGALPAVRQVSFTVEPGAPARRSRHSVIHQEVPPPVAVHIRLTRVGATKQPTYRFVVADSRSARDGRSLETLGHYNPRADPVEISVDAARATDWLNRGAKPSATVERLFRRVGILPEAR